MTGCRCKGRHDLCTYGRVGVCLVEVEKGLFVLRKLLILSAIVMTAASCDVGSSGTCVGAGDCRPGYICRDGSCVAAEGGDPRAPVSDAGYRVCSAAGGLFRIQYHAIDEIDCLIDTFPVWDNPPTVGVLHHGNGWRVRPSMSLTVQATITIMAPDNLDMSEIGRFKVWHRSQSGELWETKESSFIDGEFVAVMNQTGEFMLARDVDALPDVLVWDTGDVALIDTGRMDFGSQLDIGGFDGAQLPDYGSFDGGVPDYGAREDVGGVNDSGIPDVPLEDLWAPDAGAMDWGPIPDIGNQGPPEGGLPDMGFPDAPPQPDIGSPQDFGWPNLDSGPVPDLGWWGTGCDDARFCDGSQPPPQLDAMLIGDTLPPGFDGPIPDAGPMPDFGVYDGPEPDLGPVPDVAPPPDDAGPFVLFGTDCTEFRNNPQACAEGGGICVQGTANPNRWYCTPTCMVGQQLHICPDIIAGACCVADGQGQGGHCRLAEDCP